VLEGGGVLEGVPEGVGEAVGVREGEDPEDVVGVGVSIGGTHAVSTAAPALPLSPAVAAFGGALPGAPTVTSGCAKDDPPPPPA